MDKIRVMVVDDHEMVRRGICSYLETEEDLEVVGQANSGKSAIKLAEEVIPDVILMDLVMQDGTGIEASEKIKQILPETQIIILTSYIDEALIFPALEAGALSYLLKTSQADEIVRAVRLAIRKESIIEPQVASKMLHKIQEDSRHLPHSDLTTREFEVLTLIGQGKTNQEIADELYIGIKTVKTHVSNILNKLGVEDRTQAAIYVHKNKLI
ncbi:MAG: response regulator transcription factor [Bacillota bacterium]|nr:response regulator transcription factor [Bacillota bacterium]